MLINLHEIIYALENIICDGLSENIYLAFYITSMAQVSANTKHRPSVGITLAHRLPRWPNIIATLGEYIMLGGVRQIHVEL